MPTRQTIKNLAYVNLAQIRETILMVQSGDANPHEAMAAITVLESFALLAGSDALDAEVERTSDRIERLVYGEPY